MKRKFRTTYIKNDAIKSERIGNTGRVKNRSMYVSVHAETYGEIYRPSRDEAHWYIVEMQDDDYQWQPVLGVGVKADFYNPKYINAGERNTGFPLIDNRLPNLYTRLSKHRADYSMGTGIRGNVLLKWALETDHNARDSYEEYDLAFGSDPTHLTDDDYIDIHSKIVEYVENVEYSKVAIFSRTPGYLNIAFMDMNPTARSRTRRWITNLFKTEYDLEIVLITVEAASNE